MSSHLPRVSILIPTFNRKELLVRSIEAALNQSFPCDVVVCDHGSSDGTPEFMEQYAGRLTYVRRETDFGPHFCWLDGLLQANGEYIHIQYDDDWVADDYIEKCLALMGDDVGMVFPNVAVVDLKTGKESDFLPFKKRGMKTGIYKNCILEKMCTKRGLIISPGAVLFRKQDVLDALYQGRLPIQGGSEYHGVGPDSFMTLITFLRYKNFGYIDETLAYFGMHEDSITVNAHADQEKKKRINQAYGDVVSYYKILKRAKWIRRILGK